jgi:hypothetical protein
MNHTTEQAKEELKAELKKGLEHLQTLRDEIRVRLHLAGMNARAEWDKLEPRVLDVERAASQASVASKRAVVEAIDALKRLRQSL